MTLSRFLPLLNLVGCLLITGVILAQWLKERGLDTQIGKLNQQLAAAHDERDAEIKRSAALENDIVQLKASIESTVYARQQTEAALAKLTAETQAHAANAATASQSNQEQAKLWETAIAERDTKIRELNAELTSTRRRLDEAIARLKQAGAR